jgi:hypothetical protein
VIPVNVVSVVIYFAPFSHLHRAIAPAVFEITIGQAMHGLELVVLACGRELPNAGRRVTTREGKPLDYARSIRNI